MIINKVISIMAYTKINNLIIQPFFKICCEKYCLYRMLFGMRTCGNTGLGLATCALGSERCNRVSKREGEIWLNLKESTWGQHPKHSFGLINSSDRSQELHICNLHVLSALPISAFIIISFFVCISANLI